MRHIFSSPDSAEIGVVQSHLEAAGIACQVRNQAASQAIPAFPFVAELWVLRYQDYEHARRLLSLGFTHSK
jgi:hypothetical protein